MPKCLRCDGFGYEVHDEDNRRVQDTCYHCAGSGEVEPEVDLHDRLLRVAYSLAYKEEMEYRKAVDNNPEGEGYEFAAAENMLSVEVYFQDRVGSRQYQFMDQLSGLNSAIQNALLEWNEMPVSPAVQPTKPAPSPNGMEAPNASEIERLLVQADMLVQLNDDIPF
jgi:hypothetical protein